MSESTAWVLIVLIVASCTAVDSISVTHTPECASAVQGVEP